MALSSFNIHSRNFVKLCRVFALVAFFALLSIGVSSGGSVSAATNPYNEVMDHCRSKKVPKEYRGACDDGNFAGSGKNLVRATLNVASYHCEDTAKSQKNKCLIDTASGYINQAVKEKADDAKGFKSDLNKVLRDAGGSLKVVSAEFSSDATCSGGVCKHDPAADPDAECSYDDCDLVAKYINPGINLLTYIFGLIAIISLIIGGIQYAASTGESQKVTAAKKRITDTLIAIVAYFFLYSFLQFLVPGGIFNR